MRNDPAFKNTMELGKLIVNLSNNELLIASLLAENKHFTTFGAVKTELLAIKRMNDSQMRGVKRCFNEEYLAIIEEQLANPEVALQVDGMKDYFMQLPKELKDAVESVLEQLSDALEARDIKRITTIRDTLKTIKHDTVSTR